jgi:hypothetical protein
LDHPIPHILIVFGDSNEGWLDEGALDGNQGGEQVELALYFINGLLLIRNHP